MPKWLMKSRVDSILRKANKDIPIQTKITGHVLTTIGTGAVANKPGSLRSVQADKNQLSEPKNKSDVCIKCDTSITWYVNFNSILIDFKDQSNV
jgi:hypothetical protein